MYRRMLPTSVREYPVGSSATLLTSTYLPSCPTGNAPSPAGMTGQFGSGIIVQRAGFAGRPDRRRAVRLRKILAGRRGNREPPGGGNGARSKPGFTENQNVVGAPE